MSDNRLVTLNEAKVCTGNKRHTTASFFDSRYFDLG